MYLKVNDLVLLVEKPNCYAYPQSQFDKCFQLNEMFIINNVYGNIDAQLVNVTHLKTKTVFVELLMVKRFKRIENISHEDLHLLTI